MPDFERDVDEGFTRGVARWDSESGTTVEDSLLPQLQEARSLALTALYDYEERNRQLGQPGVSMFAEWIALAAIIRAAHHEPPLQENDVEMFLPAAVGILNTLFCPPPS